MPYGWAATCHSGDREGRPQRPQAKLGKAVKSKTNIKKQKIHKKSLDKTENAKKWNWNT